MAHVLSKPMQATAMFGLILLVIILPFVLFGAQIERAALDWSGAAGPKALGAGVIALLALDILLPIPSSIVSLIAGKTLSFIHATAVIWIGMTLGCYVGVLIARGMLVPVAKLLRLELPTAEATNESVQRRGWVSLIMMRPVPVLAEASVLYAAVRGYPTGRLMLATSIANLPIACLYAYAGKNLLGDVPLWIMLAILAVFSAPALLRPLLNRTGSPKI